MGPGVPVVRVPRNGETRVMLISVAGHFCVDLVPQLHSARVEPGQLIEVGPLDVRLGGCVANTGLALRDLGADVCRLRGSSSTSIPRWSGWWTRTPLASRNGHRGGSSRAPRTSLGVPGE